MAQTPEPVLLLRLIFAAPSAPRLRRRREDVRNARVIHFFIQRGQFLLGDFFDLRRSIVDQRRQLRELFFLVFGWCRYESVQSLQKVLHLIGQGLGVAFERGAGISKAFAFTNDFLRDCIHFFLQFIGGFDDIARDFRAVGFFCVLFPLLSRGLQRCLYAFDCFPVLIRGLGHGVELIDYGATRGPVGGQNYDARVFFEHDFLRGFLVSSLDPDGVFARLDEWPARPESISCRDGFELLGCRFRRRIRAQIPVCAVHARCARPVQLPKHFPVFVQHGDFYFAFLLFRRVGLRLLLGRVFLRRFRGQGFLQVVAQDRAVRRILCGERFLPPAPTAGAYVPRYRPPPRKESQPRAPPPCLHVLHLPHRSANP